MALGLIRKVSAAATVAAAAALCGCTIEVPAQPTLAIGVPGRTTHLDPARGADAGTAVVAAFSFEALPKIASAVVRTDDRTWTFEIPKGRHFSDGTALDANSIAANFARWRSGPGAVSDFAAYTSVFENPSKPAHRLARVAAASPTRVVITTAGAFSDLVSALSDVHFSIGSPAAFARGDAAFDALPVGSGPYRVERWVPGDFVAFAQAGVAGQPYASIYLRDVPDSHTALLALEKDDLAIVYDLPPRYLAEAEANELHVARAGEHGRYCGFAADLARRLRVCPPRASVAVSDVERRAP